MDSTAFKLMGIFKRISEKFNPKIEERVKTFGIKDRMTIVDYGCGPGMYIYEFSKNVGKNGKVFAVDVIKSAENEIEKIKAKHKINNVQFYLAEAYNCKINDSMADIVIALDLFHKIDDKNIFLNELYRICKDNGILIIDDGHQPRIETKKALNEIKKWKIIEETKDHIKCKK